MNARESARRFTGSRLVRGTATLGGGRLAAAGLSAVWLVIAARTLPVAAFGDLAALLSVGGIFVVISDLGYPYLLSRAVATSGRVNRATVGVIIRRRLLVGLGTAGLTAVAYLVVATDHRLVVPVLYGVSVLATITYSSISAALRGLHVYRPEALNEVVSRAAVLVVGAALLAAGGGLVAAVGVYALTDVGSLVVMAVVLRRHTVDGPDGIDHDALRLRHHGHLTVGRTLAAAYFRSDIWLVSLFRGPIDAAHYGAPYRLLDGILLIPRAAGAIVAAHVPSDGPHPDRRRIAAGAAALTAAVAVPVALFATPIVTGLFGTRYEASGPVLMVLALSAIPGAVVMVLLPWAGLHAGRSTLRVVALALALNLGLNLAIIPIFGPIGAASTTLACQLALAWALLRVSRAGAAAARPRSEVATTIR